MTGRPLTRRGAGPQRVGELARTAANLSRTLLGARLTDGQDLGSLPGDADAALRDARSRSALPAGWVVGNRLTTVADLAVLELRDDRGLAAVLKLSRSAAGDDNLRAQAGIIGALAGDQRLGEWRRLLPEVLTCGETGGRRYAVERAVAGTVGTSLPDGGGGDAAVTAAVRAVAELHRATGRPVGVSEPVAGRWLEPALPLLVELPTPRYGPSRRHELTERIRERVLAGTRGRSAWLGRTHGDYFPGNIFFGPAGEVCGIIDWGESREDDLALLDPMTYLLVDRTRSLGRPLGTVVRDLCRAPVLTDRERAVLELHGRSCPADPLDVDVVALLAWLRHVANNLLKSPRYAASPVWIRRNVEPVLAAAARF